MFVEGLCTKTVEPTVTTSSLTMEVEAVTHAIQWLASQRDAQITHDILTDSMNLLQKVESGMGCPDWHTAMHSLRLQGLLLIYGASDNEWADKPVSTGRYHIWSAAWRGRGAPELEELSEHGQARVSHHWSPEGKRSGERKGPTFHPPRSGTRQMLALFRGQPWGDCWETGRSAYGPFRGLRCHLELKLKLLSVNVFIYLLNKLDSEKTFTYL